MNSSILQRFYLLSLLFVFLLVGYGCDNSERSIVGQYTERSSGVNGKVKQFLILTTGQEYYKVHKPKEDAPPPGIPGKYFYGDDPVTDLDYEIVLNSNGTASYEAYSTKLVASPYGVVAMVFSIEKDKIIEKLKGKWRQKEDETIEIRLR